jgi:hypothetical protein
VQGQFQEAPGANIRLDATMVRAGDAQIAATGSGRDPLSQLFDLEKSVVFQLLTKTGVPISPAESIAISERPTKDLQAFLLYSRGLESQDRGDFRAAGADFKAAAQRDPTFQAAAQQSQSSAAASSASGTPDNTLAAVVGGASPSGGGPSPGIGQTLALGVNGTVPGAPVPDQGGGTTGTVTQPRTDPLCEAANCQGLTGGGNALIGTIIIIIKRP